MNNEIDQSIELVKMAYQKGREDMKREILGLLQNDTETNENID